MAVKKGKRQKAKEKGQGSRIKVLKKGKKEIKKTKEAVKPEKKLKSVKKIKLANKSKIKSKVKPKKTSKEKPKKIIRPAKKRIVKKKEIKKAKPVKKTAKPKSPKKVVKKKAAPALSTRADMVSSMIHEFRRDIMVLPGKCDACADRGGPQCVDACKKAISYQHKKIKPISRITIKKANGFNIPLLCHNCEEAPCMSACMTGTRRRLPETGWVETDYKNCVGCWMCVMACPFGAITRSEDEHLARKCDGCTSHKIAPCVAACKPGALVQTGVHSYDYKKRKEYAERLGYQQHLLG